VGLTPRLGPTVSFGAKVINCRATGDLKEKDHTCALGNPVGLGVLA